MSVSFAFIDEAGIADNTQEPQPFFAVGFLKVERPETITQSLLQKHFNQYSSLKTQRKSLLQSLIQSQKPVTNNDISLLLASTRHYEYKFSDVTVDKLQRYKDFLDVCFGHDIHFCSLVIDKNDPLFNKQVYGNYWEAYLRHLSHLCSNNHEKNESLVIVADFMKSPLSSQKTIETEILPLPCVSNVLRVQSVGCPLVQLCDLFLGSVVHQWKLRVSKVGQSNRARAKTEFTEYLVSKLLIPKHKKTTFPLAQSITINSPFYFSVWPFRLKRY